MAVRIGTYARALRIHQWVKNALVFLPMLNAHIVTLNNLVTVTVAASAFCLLASAAYLINDLSDLQADRQHHTKRLRPLASGEMPLRHARILAPLLVLAGGGIAASVSLGFLWCSGVYLSVALAYSFTLKRQPVLDVMALAGLYTLRVVAGGAALSIPVSAWLLAFCLFLFLCLALIKRVIELQAQYGDPVTSGRGYRESDLPLLKMLCVASGYASVLVLALYINSAVVVTLYAHPEGLWAVCVLVLYWITRALFLAHRGDMQDDPVLFVLKDRVSLGFLMLISFVVWACTL